MRPTICVFPAAPLVVLLLGAQAFAATDTPMAYIPWPASFQDQQNLFKSSKDFTAPDLPGGSNWVCKPTSDGLASYFSLSVTSSGQILTLGTPNDDPIVCDGCSTTIDSFGQQTLNYDYQVYFRLSADSRLILEADQLDGPTSAEGKPVPVAKVTPPEKGTLYYVDDYTVCQRVPPNALAATDNYTSLRELFAAAAAPTLSDFDPGQNWACYPDSQNFPYFTIFRNLGATLYAETGDPGLETTGQTIGQSPDGQWTSSENGNSVLYLTAFRLSEDKHTLFVEESQSEAGQYPFASGDLASIAAPTLTTATSYARCVKY